MLLLASRAPFPVSEARHACLVDISATINPLCIFGTTFTWGGDILIAPTHLPAAPKACGIPII